MELTSTVIWAVMVLAAVTSIQFYKGRKWNLQLMDHYLRSIEDVIKPEDKDYVWLGGYIGFRASYKVNRGNIRKFEYTLTLLPRHSLLYFPIALLTSRHDKLYIVVKPFANIKREAHLIQKGYYRLKPDIENEPLLQSEEVEIAGKKYEALFEKRRDMEKLKSLVESMSKPQNIKHVALTPKTNVFYVQMKPEPETVENDVREIMEFLNREIKVSPFSS